MQNIINAIIKELEEHKNIYARFIYVNKKWRLILS